VFAPEMFIVDQVRTSRYVGYNYNILKLRPCTWQ